MKKSKIIVIALCVLVAGGLFFAGQHLFVADNGKDVTIDKGVFIGGIDVAGMTAQEAKDTLNAYLNDLKAQTVTLVGPNGNMELTLGDMGLSAKIDEAVRKATGTAKASNLITRFMLLKDLEGENLVLDMGLAIDKQLTGNLIHQQLEKLEIPAVDWDLKKEGSKFVVIEGSTGTAVDIVSSVNAISKDIAENWQNGAKKDAQYTLATTVTNPRGSKEELAKVKDLLRSFSTDFSSSNEGRKKNVTTGCSKINGTLLYPGDTFSAHGATAPYTEKNGYGIGGAYSNGELVESMGGGICQVSTTLYNAAIRAELKITMRAAHSMVVSYVDPSVDAAIAGTYKDLRFRNDFDFPVYIEGYCKKGIITFNIYGLETRDPNRTIRFENEIVSVDDPDTEYTLDKNVKIGTYKVKRSEHIGYTARLWKIVSVNGVDTEKIRMNRSTYKASCKQVTIGTKGATAEQIAIIKEALKTKDDAYIKNVVKNINKAPEPTPEPEPTPTPSESPSETPSESPEPGTGNSENPVQEPAETV